MKTKKTLENLAKKARMSVLPIAVGIESSIATGTSIYYLMKVGRYITNNLKETGPAGETLGCYVGPALPIFGGLLCAYFGVKAIYTVIEYTKITHESRKSG